MVAPLGFEPRLDTLEPCGTIRYAREPYGASAGSRTLSTYLEGRDAATNTSLAYLEPPSGNAPNSVVYKTTASLQCFGGIWLAIEVTLLGLDSIRVVFYFYTNRQYVNVEGLAGIEPAIVRLKAECLSKLASSPYTKKGASAPYRNLD